MGFFRKKERLKKETMFLGSSKTALDILNMAIAEIDSFQIEYEIDFIYKGIKHVMGIDYDRKNAPKKGYYPEYMSVYLDEQKFKTSSELYTNGYIEGERFMEVAGIELDISHQEALERGYLSSNDVDID